MRSGVFGTEKSAQQKSTDVWGITSGKAGSAAGPVTILQTTFNEGVPPANISGTSPTLNVHGNLWAQSSGAGALQFSAGGAFSPGANNSEIIDTGASAYTVTFGGLTNTATNFVMFSTSNITISDRMEVMLLGAGGIALREVVAGAVTVIQTQPVAAGATGSVVAVVNGTSITVTAFGQAPMSYTIPAGHADIGGRFVCLFSQTFASVFGSVKVTVP